MKRLQNEPVITAATIAALIQALLQGAVAFGLDLNNEQMTAIMTVVGIALPIAFAIWARGKVTPLVNPRDNDGNQLVKKPMFDESDGIWQ